MTHEYGWQDVLMVNLACVAEPSEIQLSDALQDVQALSQDGGWTQRVSVPGEPWVKLHLLL